MSFRDHRLVTGAVLAGALSLALAGCNKTGQDAGDTSAAALPALPATLPMTNAPAQQGELAPPPTALPAARPIRVVRVTDPRDAYAYADQAGYFSQSLGDGPPDYGFAYDGVRPWAWQGYDGSRVFLEPVDGGYRYYYYRPGADRPYFIRDPDYAYGYDGDQLAVIYGPDGGLVPYADYGPRLGFAAAYLWRAQRLFEASRDRQAIAAAAWVDRQASIIAYRERWAANRDRQADWAAYHAEEAAQQSRYWAEEAARRDADQQRFAAWRQHDFETPPPPRAIPPRWQQASWARDGARYAPIAAAAVGGGALAWFAHLQKAMTGAREAPRQPLSAALAPPPMPLQHPRVAPGDEAERYGGGVRPPAPQVRAARPLPPQVERHAVATHGPVAPHGSFEMARRPSAGPAPATRDQNFAIRREIAPPRPVMRPAEQIATVHAGNRSPAVETRHAEDRRAAAPMVERIAAPPRRAPQADRPAEPPRLTSEVAPPHRGDHAGGGRPDGGERGERHR